MSTNAGSRATKVVVATTVMLSFISFWRAAAIVLCDLASSAFYAGGIAETELGKSAPWFILGIMLFSYCVRAVYVESSSMFVRGGVYRVVHEAMGGTLAKFSVSALMFDYVLTGPISGVSAGLYFAGLLNEAAEWFHQPELSVNPNYFAAVFAILVTLYFWRQNIRGIHESSQKALRIMQLTSVMVVILFSWCLVTMLTRGFTPVPPPTMPNLHFRPEALGWLRGTVLPSIPFIAICIGLGHSLLAMSGFETLAQINRELAHPKLQNLKRAGDVIFVYSVAFTSLVSFFAVMLIPDAERPKYLDNLIGGLSMNMVGPMGFRLLFHAFVVLVGTVILAGAVNTAIVGSNGVLNRVAEDGVLPDWFRHPHRRFGTTHRAINGVVILQIATIAITRGNVELLGAAYAFGVVWSFAMKALSVLVLRYKMPEAREWRVPLNFRVGGVEVPVGLGLITLFLFTLAVVNLFTKEVATIAGAGFTVAFFIVFAWSERYNKQHRKGKTAELEKFRLDTPQEFSVEAVTFRPGGVVVAVRNPNQLEHLEKVLEKTDTSRMDIAVVTVKHTGDAGFGEHELRADEVFSDDIAKLFSLVVNRAEKAGKHVELVVVPGRDPNKVLVETAGRLKASLLVIGLSGKMTASEQAKAIGDAWETLPQPRPQLSVEIFDGATRRSQFFNLGPHPPRLWPEDLELLHRLWLELGERGLGSKLHHRDVVHVALKRLEDDLNSADGDVLISELNRKLSDGGGDGQQRLTGSG